VTSADIVSLIVGALTGLGVSTAFVLALFLGFCIILGFPKLRATTGRRSMVIKSLEEKVGQEAFARYMTPDAPHGPIDVLKTPELLERAARKVS
jgi:acid phosphatase family membrane protein YuiD